MALRGFAFQSGASTAKKEVVCLFATLCVASCGGETPEQRIEVSARVSSFPEEPFETAFGWVVHVDAAWMSIGSLALLEGQALSRLPSQPSPSFWHGWLVKTAHAHPGHYQEGQVLAELLSPAQVDLLTATGVGRAHALTAQPGSGKVTLATGEIGPLSQQLDNGSIRVVGHAERPDAEGNRVVRHFVAAAAPADLTSTPPVEISGCPVEGGPLAPGRAIELRVDLALWFDQVDFEQVEPGTATDPTLLSAGSRARNGFLRGLTKAAAYRFHLVDEDFRP